MAAPRPLVTIYTDGGCIRNPGGAGGYGVVLMSGKHRGELSGGFRSTTNNRMELMAAIVGLEALRGPSDVVLYTDSQYLHNGIAKGWARGWKARNWVKSDGSPALNPDLWDRLLALVARHNVTFQWVKGHAGDPNNERCDQLSTAAMRQPGLPDDAGYGGR